MIDKNNMDRIIGDYNEILMDILMKEYSSKNFKFFAKKRANKQRRKLLDSLDIFENSNYTLKWSNLIELFVRIKNSLYYNEEEYYRDIIKITKINQNLEAQIKTNEYNAIITFENVNEFNGDNGDKFNLKINHTNNGKNLDIYLSELYSTNKFAKELVANLNQLLMEILVTFIRDIINEQMRR